MAELKLLGISGSLRAGSVNTKLLKEAIRLFGPADATIGDIRFPLYDGDLEEEQGVPEAVQLLSDQIAAADAVVISSPEYNQSIPGGLKNALDWVSRTEGGPWKNKPVVLLAAAAGRAGGARAAYALRLAMAPFRPLLIPAPEVLVGGAHNEFDDDGRRTGEAYVKFLTEAMALLRETAEAR